MKRFLVTLLGVVVMLLHLATGVSATSFTTIVVDGTNDFEADEDVPGTSGSIWYFTWNASNFYFGANNPDIDDNNPTKWVHLYMDTDPHGSAGTSTGINYNTQQPGLPFNADYHFRWKNDDSYINLQSWNGSSWVDGAQAGINRSRSGQFIEFVIPRANLGSPEAVKVVAGMINEASGVESTFFMTPSSNTPGYDANYTSYFGFPLIEGVSPDASCNVDTYPAGSKATGGYNTASTWTGSTVPPSGSSTSVTIASGHTVTLDVDTTLRCLTVLAGGGFDGGSGNNTVQIANGGRVQLAGAYTRNTETLSFAGAGTLAGTATLNHLALSGAVSFSTGLTVDGILTINANGAVISNAPTYGASSTLRYNSGGPYTANIEWIAGASGPGVPQDVQVSASSTNVTLAGAAVRTARGSVTINAGATLTLDGSAGNGLNVRGNWTNNGSFSSAAARTVTFNGASGTQTIAGSTTFYNLTLNNSGATTNFGASTVTIANVFTASAGTMNGGTSTFIFTGSSGSITGSSAKNFYNLTIDSGASVIHPSGGGNITISGDFTNNGVFSQAPERTTTFSKTGSTTMSGSGSTTFGGVVVQGGTTLNAGTHSFTVTGNPWQVSSGGQFDGGTATVTFSGLTGQIGIQGAGTHQFNNLLIDTGRTLSNNPENRTLSVKGNWTNHGSYVPGTSTVIFNGSSGQTIGGTGSTTFFNLVLNNVAGASLANGQTVDGTLTLTNGRLTLGGHNLTLGPSAPAVAGALNASNMVVADGAGALCRRFGTISSYTYPIGDATGTPEYSPVTGVTVSGTGSGTPSVCFRVVDDVHPDLPTNLSTYISRYWNGAVSGGSISALSYDATFSFVAADQVGAEGMNGKKWDGGFPWNELGVVSGTSFTGSSLGSFSDFTAFKSGVLAVMLAEFYAEQVENFVRVTWETVSELNNAGFNLYRSNSPAGALTLLANVPSQAPGSAQGFTYTFEDLAVQPGTTYWYWLEDISLNGATTLHGPVSATVLAPTAVTLGALRALPTANAVPLAVVALAPVALAIGGVALQRRRSH